MLNCQISGLGEKEEDFKEQIIDLVEKKCEKIGAIRVVEELKVRFKKHHADGERAKYSANVHMFSSLGEFRAESTEWDIILAVKEALRTIETEFKRKKDRSD
jgi:ribosome-associated translation inhibitor RaiA